MIAAFFGPLLQLAQKLLGNGGKVVLLQRAKHHHLVHAAQKLRPKIGAGFLQRLLLLAGEIVFAAAKAHGRFLPGKAARPQIAGKQHHRVGKIGFAAQRIRQTAIL